MPALRPSSIATPLPPSSIDAVTPSFFSKCERSNASEDRPSLDPKRSKMLPFKRATVEVRGISQAIVEVSQRQAPDALANMVDQLGSKKKKEGSSGRKERKEKKKKKPLPSI